MKVEWIWITSNWKAFSFVKWDGNTTLNGWWWLNLTEQAFFFDKSFGCGSWSSDTCLSKGLETLKDLHPEYVSPFQHPESIALLMISASFLWFSWGKHISFGHDTCPTCLFSDKPSRPAETADKNDTQKPPSSPRVMTDEQFALVEPPWPSRKFVDVFQSVPGLVMSQVAKITHF